MRVSDSHIFQAMQQNLGRARTRVAEAQARASSGLRVDKPSDDPVAAAAARRERSKQALAEAGIKAAELASSQLTGADHALGEMFDSLMRVKELALAAASDTGDALTRRAAAEEVQRIREQLVALGNTEVAGSYVFGGYRDGAPPFEASGLFAGDTNVREIEVLPGVRVSASAPAAQAFGMEGGVDLFATLDGIVSALEANDPDGVRASLGALDAGQAQVLDARARTGAMLNSLDVARAVADRHAYTSQIETARLVEIDEVSALTDLVKAKSALELALATAQQLPVGGLARSGG